jgi:hypothetical protein
VVTTLIVTCSVQHREQFAVEARRVWPIGLVHDEQVADFHQPGLEELDAVSQPWSQHDHDEIRDASHFDFALADTDRLDEHDVTPDETHHPDDALDAERKAAEVASRGHRPHEDHRVGCVPHHPHAVAQDSSPGER